MTDYFPGLVQARYMTEPVPSQESNPSCIVSVPSQESNPSCIMSVPSQESNQSCIVSVPSQESNQSCILPDYFPGLVQA
jgi:hypothetical protein